MFEARFRLISQALKKISAQLTLFVSQRTTCTQTENI